MLVKSRQRAERFISWLFKLAAGGRQRRRAELARQAPVEVRHELVSAVIPYSTRRVLCSQAAKSSRQVRRIDLLVEPFAGGASTSLRLVGTERSNESC